MSTSDVERIGRITMITRYESQEVNEGASHAVEEEDGLWVRTAPVNNHTWS